MGEKAFVGRSLEERVCGSRSNRRDGKTGQIWNKITPYMIPMWLAIALGRTTALTIGSRVKAKSMQMQNKCAKHDSPNVTSHVCD